MGKTKKLRAAKRENAKLERKLTKTLRKIEALREQLAAHEQQLAQLLASIEQPADDASATEDAEPDADTQTALTDGEEVDPPPAVEESPASPSEPTRRTTRRRAARQTAEQIATEE